MNKKISIGMLIAVIALTFSVFTVNATGRVTQGQLRTIINSMGNGTSISIMTSYGPINLVKGSDGTFTAGSLITQAEDDVTDVVNELIEAGFEDYDQELS